MTALLQEAVTAALRVPVPALPPTAAAAKREGVAALCAAYLEHALTAGGPRAFPAAREWLLQHVDLPHAVYETLLDMLQALPSSPAAEVRAVFDGCLACYGADATETWLRYVRFEHGAGAPERVSVVHQRATRALRDPRDFQRRFSQWREDP
eukprot:TRINITY_DN6656_c0_g1_i1.p2 TRINITY_DN6656_c0_g1~~TRINITY_DN6656_c0_g1_i1.p2  ORF type:complete len:152 (+),score=57.49 TRINITY_DN6656_c0_g1_i1:822-1277(+)